MKPKNHKRLRPIDFKKQINYFFLKDTGINKKLFFKNY